MAEKTVPTTTESQAPVTREETRYLAPPVDIYEIQEALTVVADLPGVSKENVSVNVDEDILTIEGRVEHSAPGEALFTQYELLNFHRQFHLGEEVDQEKITADIQNGVLTIQLPKKEKVKPKRIAVNVK